MPVRTYTRTRGRGMTERKDKAIEVEFDERSARPERIGLLKIFSNLVGGLEKPERAEILFRAPDGTQVKKWATVYKARTSFDLDYILAAAERASIALLKNAKPQFSEDSAEGFAEEILRAVTLVRANPTDSQFKAEFCFLLERSKFVHQHSEAWEHGKKFINGSKAHRKKKQSAKFIDEVIDDALSALGPKATARQVWNYAGTKPDVEIDGDQLLSDNGSVKFHTLENRLTPRKKIFAAKIPVID